MITTATRRATTTAETTAAMTITARKQTNVAKTVQTGSSNGAKTVWNDQKTIWNSLNMLRKISQNDAPQKTRIGVQKEIATFWDSYGHSWLQVCLSWVDDVLKAFEATSAVSTFSFVWFLLCLINFLAAPTVLARESRLGCSLIYCSIQVFGCMWFSLGIKLSWTTEKKNERNQSQYPKQYSFEIFQWGKRGRSVHSTEIFYKMAPTK